MLFKTLNEDGIVCHHNEQFEWPLPIKNKDGTWIPGDWVPPITGPLVACINGYHLCTLEQLLDWLNPAIFVAEYRGDRLDVANKVVVREARLLRQVETWNKQTTRLLLCDWAEHVLHFFEDECPGDSRPRRAIEIGRRFANGKATQEELIPAKNAARVAARTFGEDAIGFAAWDAGSAACVSPIHAAIWTIASRAAAIDAENRAWTIERQWRAARLQHYLEL